MTNNTGSLRASAMPLLNCVAAQFFLTIKSQIAPPVRTGKIADGFTKLSNMMTPGGPGGKSAATLH